MLKGAHRRGIKSGILIHRNIRVRRRRDLKTLFLLPESVLRAKPDETSLIFEIVDEYTMKVTFRMLSKISDLIFDTIFSLSSTNLIETVIL